MSAICESCGMPMRKEDRREEMKKMKPEEAEKVAKENLAKMPAWKERRR